MALHKLLVVKVEASRKAKGDEIGVALGNVPEGQASLGYWNAYNATGNPEEAVTYYILHVDVYTKTYDEAKAVIDGMEGFSTPLTLEAATAGLKKLSPVSQDESE